jgi:hypothetical protein
LIFEDTGHPDKNTLRDIFIRVVCRQAIRESGRVICGQAIRK